jgi:hypothetical protein
VNLPEKKGAHRMDRKKMALFAGYGRKLWLKSRSTSERKQDICAIQSFFACATPRTYEQSIRGRQQR